MTIKQKFIVVAVAAVSLSACASTNTPGNSHAEKAMVGDHEVMTKKGHEQLSGTSSHHDESNEQHGALNGHHGVEQNKHEDAKAEHASDMGDHGKGMKGKGGHGHQAWVEPPHQYEEVRYSGWGDKASASRGAALFNQQCAACHGQDGTGNGPVAASLEHPPADLTNHFHRAPGDGDGYLFWRLAEGGQVEPFKSAKSAMPAFEDTLSEAQRWDVLTYVHQAFHKGFKQESHGAEAMSEMHEKASHGMKDQH